MSKEVDSKIDEIDVVYRILITIDNRHVCLFEVDFPKRCRDFLEGVDAEYYSFLSEQMSLVEDSKDAQRAAVTLRMAYSQGLEHFFALMAAAMERLETIPHWLCLYLNPELRKIIGNIRRPTIDGVQRTPSKNPFRTIAEQILAGSSWDSETIEGFAEMWLRFSNDFLDEAHDREYNSFKHGFRARAGGYSLSIGVEDRPGVPAKPDAMRLVGFCKFGSRTYEKEELAKGNYRLHPLDRNWDPRKYVDALKLLSISIRNLISFCQQNLGVDPASVTYMRPDNKSAYLQPWSYDVGMQIGGFRKEFGLPESAFLTKQQMEREIAKVKSAASK